MIGNRPVGSRIEGPAPQAMESLTTSKFPVFDCSVQWSSSSQDPVGLCRSFCTVVIYEGCQVAGSALVEKVFEDLEAIGKLSVYIVTREESRVV